MFGFSNLELVLVLSTAALFALVSIGFSVQGGTRWVKIATLVLLASFAATMVQFQGVGPVMTTLGLMVVSTVGLIAFAFSTWRMPIIKTFQQTHEGSCPQYARKKIASWTEQLQKAGFVASGDYTNSWKINGKDKLVFVRFLKHHSDPVWVELHAQHEPKITARMAVSPLRSGAAVMTADQQSDQELLRDAKLTIGRVPSGSSCEELLSYHREQCATAGQSLDQIGDLPQGHVDVHARWAESAIASGVGKRDGEFLRMNPAAIPATILRTFGAWFQ